MNNLIEYITQTLADIRELDPEDINIDEHFVNMGLTSIDTLIILKIFKDELGIVLSPAILVEHPNVKSLAKYLSK